MSITRLMRLTAYGRAKDKERILFDLQDMGCLHLIPLSKEARRAVEAGPSSEAREALKFLLSCPQRRHQVGEEEEFDAEAVERGVLKLKESIHVLEDERDFLRNRIKNLKPFGDFDFPDPDDIGCNKLWFYVMPIRGLVKVKETNYVWQEVNRDNRFVYVVVVAPSEPVDMPFDRLHIGNQSLMELRQKYALIGIELEDLQAERIALTRWIDLYVQNLARLEDVAERSRASAQTFDDDPVFAIQAWVPAEEVKNLRAYAKKMDMALELSKPTKEEEPPTLLKNKPVFSSGQDLVSFYTTPNYWLWDPSGIVFIAFTVFFAMIVSDAAYGAVMALILALLWKKMGKSVFGRRLRTLCIALVSATILYGIMVGSYFGISPPEYSFIHRMKVIELNNFGMMMKISILVGVIHLIAANFWDAWNARRSLYAFVPLGWVFMFFGAVVIWFGTIHPEMEQLLKKIGIALMLAGAAAVVLFTSTRGPVWKRIILGLKGLTRISGAFGDTLSYLRLFALGLASASLATTFNELSGQVGGSIPGIGFLFSILIIIIGHGMNLVLAIASGVIHGLRLNFIEFFNWSMPLEGYPFKAFARKEKASWTT